MPHVGIVFVHGIGTQAAGETLLDWGGKLIGLLLDARTDLNNSGDPVIDCQLDPGPGEARYIELQLPKAEGPGELIPEQHWVMTEAWWANRVRPPAFGEMAEWLGPRGAIRRIVEAMLPRRRGEHDPRLRPQIEVRPLVRRQLPSDDPASALSVVQEDADYGDVYRDPSVQVRIDAPSWLGSITNGVQDIGTKLTTWGAGLYFQAVSALVLVIYGALRSIEKILPIGPLRNGALTRPIDGFMLDWFGDVFVLLRDPAQAASVRGRLVDALLDLHANKCKTTAVVAHSGGAIVSYMTLADSNHMDIEVDRLITLGQGMNLAWRLLASNDGTVDKKVRLRLDRLYTDVLAKRDNLKWDDFWASQDPAPVGVLAPDADTMDNPSLGRIRSHAVWNRLAFREDHGTYWDNDEEFLIPLARLLDQTQQAPRIFAEANLGDQSRRRRRRLSFLSIWRQLALVAPTAAIVSAFVFGSSYIRQAADTVAAVWSAIPGNEIVSDPITNLRSLKMEVNPIVLALAETGIWVVAAVLALLTLMALLAPTERPLPWNDRSKPWWRPFNLFALFLRVIPWVVATPVVVSVGWAAIRFIGGATDIGGQTGMQLLKGLVTLIVVAGLGYLIFGPKQKITWLPQWARDALELLITIVVMAVVATLAISPFVAILVYSEVGTTVLGCATVIVAFQVLGRIGTWRWNVWDGRERVAARSPMITTKTGSKVKPYPPLARIAVQMSLLIATVFAGFFAVVFELSPLTWLAIGGGAVAVLLGVALDVFDTARQARRGPTDAMLQGAWQM